MIACDEDDLTALMLILATRRSMVWGGTLLPKSGSLVPAPFPTFMDGQWPDVLGRIAETGVYDEWTEGEGSAIERGANHVRFSFFLCREEVAVEFQATCSLVHSH